MRELEQIITLSTIQFLGMLVFNIHIISKRLVEN